jgi:hypothetical protein
VRDSQMNVFQSEMMGSIWMYNDRIEEDAIALFAQDELWSPDQMVFLQQDDQKELT